MVPVTVTGRITRVIMDIIRAIVITARLRAAANALLSVRKSAVNGGVSSSAAATDLGVTGTEIKGALPGALFS
jgi:hypothetical protein